MFRVLREKFSALPHQRICEVSVLTFAALALLWKGGKGLEATWLLMALAWVCNWVYWYRKPKDDAVPFLLWAAGILFIIFTGLSYGFSHTANYGLDEVLRTAALVLMAFWMFRLMADRDGGAFFHKLVLTVIVASLLAGAIGVLVYALQPVNRFVGTFFDYRFHTDYWPNAWAQYLLLAWPLAAWWMLRAADRVQWMLRLLVLGFLVGFLFLSYSRGAFIAFAGQIVLWWVIVFLQQDRSFPWRMAFQRTGAVLLIALAVFLGMNGVREQYHPVQDVAEKVTFTAAEGSSSVTERRQFWAQSFALSLEKPLLGWGPYSFRFVQPRLQEEVYATSDHPHNLLLKIAMERGWIALLLFLSFLGMILLHAARAEMEEEPVPEVGIVLVALAGLLAHNLIDYNLQFVGIALPTWLLLGFLAAGVPWRRRIILNKKVVRFFELSIATFLLAIAVVEARHILVSSFGRHAEVRGETQEAIAWYEEARMQRFSRDLHLSRTKILYEDFGFEEAQSALDEYMEQNAQDARAWRRQGDIELSWGEGDIDRAIAAYRRAYDLGKYNDIGIVHGFVTALVVADRRDELVQERDAITRLMRDYATAIERNAHFIALSPNVEELIGLANTMARIYPEDAPFFEVMSAKVDHHARIERQQIESRPPGYLW